MSEYPTFEDPRGSVYSIIKHNGEFNLNYYQKLVNDKKEPEEILRI